MAETRSISVVVVREGGSWLLNDRSRGLVMEPLVAGMGRMLERFAEGIPGSSRGLRLQMSDQRFAGFQGEIERQEADAGGYWYHAPAFGLRGWLGNRGLTRYFPEPPEHIFVRGEPLAHDDPAVRGEG